MKLLKFNLFLVLAIAATGLLAPLTYAAGTYDGRWNVRAIADPGRCTDDYSISIKVSDGDVQYEGLLSALASGTVSPRGVLTLRVAQVKVSGHLASRTGSGAWRSPSCTGTWTASRV